MKKLEQGTSPQYKADRNMEIYLDKQAKMSYKDMMKKYGLSENTLSRIIKDVEYKLQLEEIREEMKDGRL